MQQAFQDVYSENVSHCYGCGRLNDHGLQIKTYWDGEETVTRFLPKPYHVAIPGYVYGGLIASLFDCHGSGTASAAASRHFNSEVPLRFVSVSLQVDFLRPTPLGVSLEIRGSVEELKEKKVVVNAVLSANGEVCAKGRIILVKMPESMQSPKQP